MAGQFDFLLHFSCTKPLCSIDDLKSKCLNCHCPLYHSASAKIYNCRKNRRSSGIVSICN